MAKKENDDLIYLFGLWENESKRGVPYLSGYMGSARLFLFKNTNKDGNEKLPDWKVFVAPRSQGRGND